MKTRDELLKAISDRKKHIFNSFQPVVKDEVETDAIEKSEIFDEDVLVEDVLVEDVVEKGPDNPTDSSVNKINESLDIIEKAITDDKTEEDGSGEGTE